MAASTRGSYPAAIYGELTGEMTQGDQDLLAERGTGPSCLVDNITAPTLLIQGTVDTIFSLQEADDTAQILIANGVPTKVLWFCGGHGLCAAQSVRFQRRRVDRAADPRVVGPIRERRRVSVDRTRSSSGSTNAGSGFSSNIYPVSQGCTDRPSSSC